MNAAVAIATSAGGSHREPDLVRNGQAIDGLQNELKGEAQLQFNHNEESIVFHA